MMSSTSPTTTRTALLASVAALGWLSLSSSAQALTLGAGGLVTDWNIKPFDASLQPSHTSSVRQNNLSPINFGESIGNRPSGGEPYDLEEMHVRNFGFTFQVLLVTGSLWKAENMFFLGDLLMNTDGLPGFDMGLVTQTASLGLVAGQVYNHIITAGLQNISDSYFGNNSIEIQVNNTPGQKAAMFVQAGMPTGPLGSIVTASYNYGMINQNGQNNHEKDTYLYEFTFQLPATLTTVDFQIGWGCGNDVIRVTHQVTRNAVPEPATAAMGWAALSALATALTRRKR